MFFKAGKLIPFLYAISFFLSPKSSVFRCSAEAAIFAFAYSYFVFEIYSLSFWVSAFLFYYLQLQFPFATVIASILILFFLELIWL